MENKLDPEILVLILQLKHLKEKLSNQINLIENNSEMYYFLTKKERKFISDDMKNRFNDIINNDFSIKYSEKEKELLEYINKELNKNNIDISKNNKE